MFFIAGERTIILSNYDLMLSLYSLASLKLINLGIHDCRTCLSTETMGYSVPSLKSRWSDVVNEWNLRGVSRHNLVILS